MAHTVTLHEGKLLTVTGVTEVVSFDENEALLHTPLGTLAVQGRELQLKKLTPEGGQIGVEGQITGLFYEEPKKQGGLWGRLWG